MTHVETSVRDMNNIVDRKQSIGFIQLDGSIINVALSDYSTEFFEQGLLGQWNK